MKARRAAVVLLALAGCARAAPSTPPATTPPHAAPVQEPAVSAPAAPQPPPSAPAPTAPPPAAPAPGELDARALAHRALTRELEGDRAGALEDLRAALAKETDPEQRRGLQNLLRLLEDLP